MLTKDKIDRMAIVIWVDASWRWLLALIFLTSAFGEFPGHGTVIGSGFLLAMAWKRCAFAWQELRDASSARVLWLEQLTVRLGLSALHNKALMAEREDHGWAEGHVWPDARQRAVDDILSNDRAEVALSTGWRWPWAVGEALLAIGGDLVVVGIASILSS